MSEELALLERGDDRVATIALNNGKVNALSSKVLARLADLAADLTANPAGAVVITGGPRLFAAGADITEFVASDDPADFRVAGPDQVNMVGGWFLRSLNAIAAIPSPTIASVSGFALGGGCELALACDLRIASTRAKFALPETLLGLIPGGGGTQRLARLVGSARAKDLIFSGRQINAAEALAIGLVDRVVEPDELDTAAAEWAAQLAAGASESIALAKAAIDRGLSTSLDEGLAIEQELFAQVFTTRDAAVGLQSFTEQGPGKAKFH